MRTLLLLLFLVSFLACEAPKPPVKIWEDYSTLDSMETLANLPKSIPESSGLIYWNKQLWTLNDGGNGAYLFEVSKKKKEKKRQVKIKGASNTDWESMTQDSNFVYIGNFGNNSGNRADLKIHRVSKTKLAKDTSAVEISGNINFNYSDQEETFLPQKRHNFDCEAMISRGDSIYLFSKNHGGGPSHLYGLSKTIENQEAALLDQFQTDGKITGATWVEEKNWLVLLGYNNSSDGNRPFLWWFYDIPGNDFFAGKSRRINLPSLLQTEGICHFEGNQFLLTNEKGNGSKGKIHLVDFDNWIKAE